MILAVVEATEQAQADALAARRAADAARQRAKRERERHVTSRDVTVTERDAETAPPSCAQVVIPSSSLRSEGNPLRSPSESSPNKPKPEKPTGSRLAEDWKPPDECWTYAEGKGFSREDAEVEFGKFRNHWLGESGQRARKLRWDFAFKKWIDNACEYRGRPTLVAQTTRPRGGGRGAVSFADIYVRRHGFASD